MSQDFSFKKVPRRSLKSYAYELIKQAIIRGDLAPGEHLREADIAAQMGVNRAPVREAFRQLDQEGMTYSHPYRGTVVLEISPRETEEVFVPTRRIIEGFAAKNAITVMTDEHFSDLEAIIEQMRNAGQEENLDQLTDLDIQFHDYMISHASGPAVLALWKNINARIHSRLLYQGIRHSSLEEVAEDHSEYLKRIRTGDPSAIDSYLASHIY